MRKLSDPNFLDIVYYHDTVILSEIWLAKNICFNWDILEYSAFHLFGNKSFDTKKERLSGGNSIYYRTYLKEKVYIAETHQSDGIWLKLSKERFYFNSDIFICCVYVPPP